MREITITTETVFEDVLKIMEQETCRIRGASILDFAKSIEKIFAFTLCCISGDHEARFLDLDVVLDEEIAAEHLVNWIQQMQHKLVSQRTRKVLQRRRDKGPPLGRPKGAKNAGMKLDKHLDEIHKYRQMGLNRATTSRLIGCHPQTLYSYLDLKGIVWVA